MTFLKSNVQENTTYTACKLKHTNLTIEHSPDHAHWMYLAKNFRWKSFRMVSLMNLFFNSGASRDWFLNTTSSSHLSADHDLFIHNITDFCLSKRLAFCFKIGNKDKEIANLLFSPAPPDARSGLPASIASSWDFFSFSIRSSSCKSTSYPVS